MTTESGGKLVSFKAQHVIRFVAVARHLSFTKAAASLRVDQPWLSQQIRQLEAEIRAQLFIRGPRGLQLTEVGKELLQDASRLADAAHDVDETLRRIRDANVQRLRLGVPGFSYALDELEKLFEEQQRRYPRTRLEYQGGDSVELVEMLRDHKLDATIICAPFSPQGLDVIFLNRSYGSLLIPKENELASIEELTVEQLRGQRLAVLPRRLSQLWESVYAPFIEAGMELVEIAEGHRRALLYHAHRQRLCVVTWQWPYEAEYCSDDMVHRPFSGWRPRRDSYLVKLAGADNSTLDRFWSVSKNLFPDTSPPDE